MSPNAIRQARRRSDADARIALVRAVAPRRGSVGLILVLVLAEIAAAAGARGGGGSPSPRHGVLHVTKDCTGYQGQVDGHCTITSSNLKAITAGSRVVYLQAAGARRWTATSCSWSGPAISRSVTLRPTSRPAPGRSPSGGTGQFASFHAKAAVSSLGGTLWGWDGTYSSGRRQLMKARVLIRIAVVAAAAALVVPAASAATPQYDGFKSGYAQLHQILTYDAAAPAVASPSRGFAWRDAGVGLVVGLLGAGLIAVSLSQLRRNRTTVLQ